MIPDSETTILVTGVTGMQGGAVARHLLAAGWRVRGLTRDPETEAARRMGEREGYDADIGEVRRLLPGLLDFRTWVARGGARPLAGRRAA